MRLNRTYAVLITALAGIAAGAASAATAPTTTTTTGSTTTPPNHHWHGHRSMLVGTLLRATRQLNLQPSQQQAIKGLMQTARTQARGAGQSNPLDITVLGNPGDANYSTAVQNAKTLAANRVQQESELAMAIWSQLTPDQQKQLPQVLANMKAQAAQRRAAWQAQHTGNG
jgi:Spy/CpxP family protein refolding chaperone